MSKHSPPEFSEIEELRHPEQTHDPGWLHGLAWASTALNRIAAVTAAALLVGMTALILVEIVFRFFSHSTYMADVLVGYGVAAITFLAAPWALEDGAMIRVTAVVDHLSGKLRWITEAFALVSAGAIMWFLISYQWASVIKLFQRGSTSQHAIPIPLWVPESFFLAGLVLLLFQIAVRVLRLLAVGHSEEQALNL